MTSELLKVADAVVEALNAADLSQEFTAERLYVPRFELKDMSTLHVSVVPRSTQTERVTRSQYQHTYLIDVGVQKKFTEEKTECDALVALVEEIEDLFAGRSCGGAVCTATKVDPIYAPQHLEQLRQFTSVLTMTFEVTR